MMRIHGEADEGGDGSGVELEITCQAPETAEPSKRAFDDPALGQDFESDGGGRASNDLSIVQHPVLAAALAAFGP